MEHFLINSTVCLFVLWLFYKLALENTSWHEFKRWYLLGSLLLATIIPLLVVKTVVIPVAEVSSVINYNNYVPSEILSTKSQPIEAIEEPFNWWNVLIGIYVIGVLVMGYRFLKNLKSFQVRQNDRTASYSIYKLILRNGITIPHSFINRIFVSKNDYEANKIPVEILEHEKAHLDQRHSYDIILIELLLIFLWFHPVLYVIRYSIKLNHEFLADRTVLDQGKDTTAYQQLLLDYTNTTKSSQLAHTFNYPIIKKRFQIMRTKTSISNGLLRSVAMVVLVVTLVIACGKEKEIRMIDHSTFFGGMHDTNENANHVYGIDVDGFQKIGTVNYNGINYDYDIENDTLVHLYFPDGEKVDIEENQLFISVQYDSKKVLNELSASPEQSRQKIESGQLKFEERATINGELKKRTLSYDELFNYDFSFIDFHKSVRNDLTEYHFYVFPDARNTIFLPMNKDYGFIELFGKAYSFEKIDNDVIITSKNGKVFDWKKFNYDIIEVEEDSQALKPQEDDPDGNNQTNTTSETKAQSTVQQPFYLSNKSNEVNNSVKDQANSKSGKNSVSEANSQDHYLRRSILSLSLDQDSKTVYQINGKNAKIESLKDYINKNEFADVSYTKGVPNTLNFSDNAGEKMTIEQFQKMASLIVENGNQSKASQENQDRTEQPPQMIGDAFHVMNLNRYTLKYQFDGESINAGKAREILIDKGQRGVYLDTIAGEPTMIIQSKFLNTGPALPTQNPLAGDGC